MAAQICETCRHKDKRCYCAPNSTCEGYEPEFGMMQAKFYYPLPNNGDRYDLSTEELIELLQKAYESGRRSNQGWSTYWWSNTFCPSCGSGCAYTTTTLLNGPGNIITYHCSNCGNSWED